MGVAFVFAQVGVHISRPEELKIVARAVFHLLPIREVDPQEEFRVFAWAFAAKNVSLGEKWLTLAQSCSALVLVLLRTSIVHDIPL